LDPEQLAELKATLVTELSGPRCGAVPASRRRENPRIHTEFSSLFELYSSLIAAKAASSIYTIAPEDCASRLFPWLAYGFIPR
jgi:hypothetical protein